MSSLWPIKVSSRTDIGCGREHNEDSFIEWRLKPRSTAAPHDGAMLAVADGIGKKNKKEQHPITKKKKEIKRNMNKNSIEQTKD